MDAKQLHPNKNMKNICYINNIIKNPNIIIAKEMWKILKILYYQGIRIYDIAISMYRTAKSLEIVEVEVYGCFIYWSYSFLHKTLIMATILCINFLVFNIIYIIISQK